MGCGASLPDASVFLSTPLAAPVSLPLVPATTKETTVAIKQKFLSLSGGDFSVKDMDGNVVAKLDGKNLSLRERTVVLDALRVHPREDLRHVAGLLRLLVLATV